MSWRGGRDGDRLSRGFCREHALLRQRWRRYGSELSVPIIIVAALVVFVVIWPCASSRRLAATILSGSAATGRRWSRSESSSRWRIGSIPSSTCGSSALYLQPKPVITEDNLVVNIDTVLYYQITDPRAAAYEIGLSAGHRPAHGHHVAGTSSAWIWANAYSREEINIPASHWMRRRASGESA